MKKPKVLVYRSEVLPYSETFIKEQISALQDWDAALFGDLLTKKGLPLNELNVVLVSKGGGRWSRLIRFINFLFKYRFSKVWEKIKKINPDIVHVHFGTDLFRFWPVLNKLNIPIVTTLHGFDINTDAEWFEQGHGGMCMRKYPSELLKISKDPKVSFIAVSKAIKKRAVERGFPEDKVTVSNIGVDTNKFRPGLSRVGGRKNILFVGRLVEKKGCVYLLEAFSRIYREYNAYKLVVVGDGPLEFGLKRIADEMNIPVDFLGRLSSEDILDQLHCARVLCLPSIRAKNGDAEGLPIVILEAQACGVPVITSAEGGAEEGIISGRTGFSYVEKDVDALTAVLKALIDSDDLADSFGEKAREFALQEMDIAGRTKELERIYDHARRSHA